MTPARPFGQGFGTMSSPAMGTGFGPAPMGTGTPFGGAPMTTGTPFGQPGGMGGMGGMPSPMQNPFMGGQQPQGMSLPPPVPPAPQPYGGGMGQPYISDRGYFGPGTMSNPTVPPATQAYQPQNFGQFGFDQQMVDYLNNQRRMSATDAGINYVYDPATQTFKGATMGGPVTKTMDQMRQEAAGYKPGMGGGMGQPYISDRGYFGPGTMSNPTGPQFGQEGVITQVSRPLTGVPQYGGGMGQPLSRAQLEAAVADDIATGRQIYRGPESQQIYNDMVAKLRGNPFAQRQQADQYRQAIESSPQYRAMQSAMQSGNIQEAERLHRDFMNSPEYQRLDQMAGQLAQQYGGGMGQPYISDRGYFGPGTMSNPTGPQYGGQDRVVTQVSRPPEQLQQEIDRLRGFPMEGAKGTPSLPPGVNPFQPLQPLQPQLSPQQQSLMNRLDQQFNRQIQPYQQQMQQLQRQYMAQPPQALQQMQQQMQRMPEFQAMQKAQQSGNMQAAERARQAFEATPQFQQMLKANEAFNQQQQQAQQKMMADPRFNQLQNQMQQLAERHRATIQQRFQPQMPQGGISAALQELRGRMG